MVRIIKYEWYPASQVGEIRTCDNYTLIAGR